MPSIAIALPSHASEVEAWIREIGGDVPDAAILVAGTFDIAAVSRWIGVPPPPAEVPRVNLCAPEPIDGEESRWLNFRAFACWTSDLVAVRVP